MAKKPIKQPEKVSAVHRSVAEVIAEMKAKDKKKGK